METLPSTAYVSRNLRLDNPAANGNNCRDPQPEITLGMRDLGTHSTKLDVLIKPLVSELREPHRKE